MIAYLKRQLPVTFRINGSGRFAQNLIKKLVDGRFMGSFSTEGLLVEGEVISPPKPLAWYPNNLAWQLDFSRTHLRKIPEMKEMHEFIKAETEMGAITRQEAVSMIPPLFLDCRPGQRILDMCAAPGSKTFQMLEALHTASDGAESSRGLVVGNDADSRRCATLTHQAQRMRSPSLLVTNHEAQLFPSIVDTDPTSCDGEYMWDRILCDVPCSGDGTLRKCPDIWRKWNQSNGNGLHLVQLKIAMRAAELLKVGGRMVYSTCTFNPIEDEAVVAELLRRTHGGLRLVDTSEMAEKLKFQPGLSTWKVMDGAGNWHESWETARSNPKLYESMFPRDDVDSLGMRKTMRFLPHHQNTGGFYVAVLEKTKDMPPLVYPMGRKPGKGGPRRTRLFVKLDVVEDGKVRVGISYPEKRGNANIPGAGSSNADGDQQDGVVLFKKREAVDKGTKSLPAWGPRGVAEGSDDFKWKGVEPFWPYKNAEMLASISDFYGIAADSPLMANLLVRSTNPLPKKILYLGDGPKLLLQMDNKSKIKIVNVGVKVFERQDSKGAQAPNSCRYRISQEGVHVVLPHMTKQIVKLSAEEFSMLLRHRAVRHRVDDGKLAEDVDGGVADGGAVERQVIEDPNETKTDKAAFFENSKTQERIASMAPGCCVVLIADEDLKMLGLMDRNDGSGVSGSLRSEQPFVLPCWKGKYTISTLVSNIDCVQMLEQIESEGEQRAKVLND
jgi:multisite-specific tRNA:(cytosine-C5)-methyltransferase